MSRPLCEFRLPAAATLLLCSLLLGCVSRDRSDTPPPPFVFRSLDLSHRDPEGRLAWDLKAPEARYELNRRLVRAVQLQGLIYQRGRPIYRITARAGTVINDGELIQLEGSPRIERLDGQPTAITGQRLRWTPRRELIELEGEPRAQQSQLVITASQARFRLDQDRLELRGQPTLRHWQSPPRRAGRPAPAKPAPMPPADLLVRLREADWYPGSGVLKAPGPAVAERRQNPSSPLQTLTASGLEGNTVRQQLSLLAPVLFRDPGQNSNIRAQRTELDLRQNLVSSDAPFEARSGRLQAWGEGFRLDLQNRSAQIPSACRIEQPEASLTAQECRWNWHNGRFAARGAVELRRRKPEQITRSTSLEGRIGRDGEALFSSPGARVHSTLRIPAPQPQAPRQRPAIAL